MIVCVKPAQTEIIIKRSRFIAVSRMIESRDEVKPFIEALKKEHVGARHVCYGFIADEKGDDFGYDDNGEPSGTAGKPIYSALVAAEARKSVIAVVRYFGGIKLGAGGLTRAYRESAAAVIEEGLVAAEKHCELGLSADGETFKKALAVLRGMGIAAENIMYADNVCCTVNVPTECRENLISALKVFGASITELGEKYVFTEKL